MNDTEEQHQYANTTAEPERVGGFAPRAFSAAKAGNAAGDYEDAFAIGDDCLAIADGATESSFARAWAQGLTEGYVAQPDATRPPLLSRIRQWVQPLQTAWHRGVAWDRLPWFAEDKARSGAFATFLAFQMLNNGKKGAAGGEEDTGSGEQETSESDLNTESKSEMANPAADMVSPLALSFLGNAQSALGDDLLAAAPEEEGAFQAFAIGDSCLFQIREDALHLAFPLTHSSQFDSRPVLLSSNEANNKRVWDDIAFEQGAFAPGDVLLFATDALARWFLVQCEAGEKPWETLCGLQTQADFETFVARLRQTRVMRNDDVTLVIVGEAAPPGLETAATSETAGTAGEETGITRTEGGA